jgi:putative hemolysin
MELINNVFKFSAKTVEDIVIHRRNIVALNVKSGLADILKLIVSEKYSRIPVYDDNIDNIIGILYIKDLISYIFKESTVKDNIRLSDVIRKVSFVPISKKVNQLLSEMKKNHIHIVVVVDEYGGTYGIVTLEDIIEEIMGDIFDEHDKELVPAIREIDKDIFEVSGDTSLSFIQEMFDLSLPVEEYDTINGFLISQLGHIPKVGDRPEISFEGVLFKVLNIEDNLIKKVILYKNI